MHFKPDLGVLVLGNPVQVIDRLAEKSLMTVEWRAPKAASETQWVVCGPLCVLEGVPVFLVYHERRRDYTAPAVRKTFNPLGCTRPKGRIPRTATAKNIQFGGSSGLGTGQRH